MVFTRQFYKILFLGIALLLFQEVVGQSTNVQELQVQLDQAIKRKDYGKASFYSYEIAEVYATEKESAKAIEYLEQCLIYGKKADDNMLMYLAYERLGLVFTETKNYSKASDNFQKALRQAKALKQSPFISAMLVQIATSYRQSGQPKKSIEPLEEALSIALHDNNLLLQQQCYGLMADAYTKTGNDTKAKEYQNLYNTLVRNRQNEEKVSELKQKVEQAGQEKSTVRSKLAQQNKKLQQTEDSLLSTKYSLEETEMSLKETKDISDKRQLQIDLLSKDKELAEIRILEQNVRLENEALIRNSIIAGALLVSALVLVLVNAYRKKIKVTKKINDQNKNIRSSINYARRIQEAMLPKPDLQKKLLPDSFVLLKPRDSVSGDFYWFTEIKNWYNPDVVFAAADCTGHGVPGAFMSMIGINALNAIIAQGIAESNLILDALHKEIRTALQQETTKNDDGMDIGICIFRKEKSILEFSGAKNSMIYIQNNEVVQVKGDVHSIGGSRSKSGHAFKKHQVAITEPTMVYLFSDGYSDQFGGPDNSKFMAKNFNKLLFDIHHKPMNDQMELLNKSIEAWKGPSRQTDDILVMGIKLEPVPVM